jgi:hypothetical protein
VSHGVVGWLWPREVEAGVVDFARMMESGCLLGKRDVAK